MDLGNLSCLQEAVEASYTQVMAVEAAYQSSRTHPVKILIQLNCIWLLFYCQIKYHDSALVF